jgi:F-type H+-transporting ATPase subunit a
MGLEFLVRVRRTALISGGLLSLVIATYGSFPVGIAFGAGVAWSLINLFLIEQLVVTITGSSRREMNAWLRAGATLAGMLALFAAGAWTLRHLSIRAQLFGFLLPLAVIALKAASTLLLQSRAWRAVTATRWRAAAIVAVLLVAAWWIVPAVLQHGARAEGTQTVTPHENAPTHESGAHAEEESGPQKFPNFVTVLARAFPDAEWAHFLHKNEAVVFSLLVGFLLCLFCFFATRNPQMIPTPLQNALELVVAGLRDFIVGIIGEKHADRFVPFLGTLGLYIWCMNLFGLIPFMDSPTSSLNVTFALGLIVFLYAQWIGIRGLGPLGYVDHMLGSPRDLTGWLLAPLMLPIHVLGELAKPISLSCRLFGNIFGEDMLLVAFVSLGVTSIAFLHLPFGLPLQLPFLLLALLTSTLQAAVFMVLSTIYFLLMLPHDDHEHEPGHETGAAQAHAH